MFPSSPLSRHLYPLFVLLVFCASTCLLFLHSTLDLPIFASSFSNLSNPSTKGTTIVSSYYEIHEGKKHSVEEYHTWLGNFLSQVDLPIVFYCAPNTVELVRTLRKDKPITIISSYRSPFFMPPMRTLGGRFFALAQHDLDPEKEVHVPAVYASFIVKPWITRRTSELNPYNSKYFYWVDAGAFRSLDTNHTFSALTSRLDEIYSVVPASTIILSSILPFVPGLDYVESVIEDDVMDRRDLIQAGFYGGTIEAIEWWHEETLRITLRQSEMNRFTAKEQLVWTHAARLNWQRIYVLNPEYRSTECGQDIWFSFEWFADSRECEIPAWVGSDYM